MTVQSNTTGSMLAISGTTLAIIGTLVNNISLDHTLAMWLWMLSNPLLLCWTCGSYKKWWNGALSIEAIAVMYFVFSISNFYGLFLA
jgi:hypothetical protein